MHSSSSAVTVSWTEVEDELADDKSGAGNVEDDEEFVAEDTVLVEGDEEFVAEDNEFFEDDEEFVNDTEVFVGQELSVDDEDEKVVSCSLNVAKSSSNVGCDSMYAARWLENMATEERFHQSTMPHVTKRQASISPITSDWRALCLSTMKAQSER